MKTFLDRLTFNVAEAGGGGAPPPGDGGAPPPVAGTPPAEAGSPPPPLAGQPAAGDGGPPAAGDFYRPENLPEHLVGKDQNETMDKLAKAVQGYRDRDASNGVPDKVEAYSEFTGDIPETIKPHLDTLKGDPLFGRIAAKAMELKVPVAAYQALTQEFVSVSAEMGMMEPIVDEKAERAALVPEASRHLPEVEQQRAAEQRMNENYAFVDGLVAKGVDPATKQFDPKRGGIAKDDAEFAKAMLGDSAKGHRFFEAMRSMANGTGQGGGPAMGHGQPGGQDAKAALSTRAALPQNTVGHREYNRASHDQLQTDYKRLYPD